GGPNSMRRQHPSERSRGVCRMYWWSVVALLFLATVASAQAVQPIDSEAQLAAMLCQNPAEEAANKLLNRNTQFVKVALWQSLANCAASAQGQGSSGKSIEIYKLILRIANQLKEPELVATSYYHLGRTYALISDFENSIQAYETSRKLFEETGDEGNLVNVL